MKKILFATTALVATAGVAAAEVSFGGYGRFGLRYDESAAKETFLESRFRMNIDAAATTYGGVRFSTRVRIQADDNGDNTSDNAALNAPRFSAEFEGLRIDVGNAGGAIDNMPGYYGFDPGLSNFVGQYSGVDYSFTGYSSQSGCDTEDEVTLTTPADPESKTPESTIARTIDPAVCVNPTQDQVLYSRYAAGAFAVASSYTDNANERWDIHFAYSGDTWGVSVGYGENNIDQDILVATGTVGFGAWDITAILGSEDLGDSAENDGTFYGISVAYDLGAATTIGFSYGDGSGDDDTQQYGIGFIHDLGGRVTLRGGIGQSDDGESTTLSDLGVRFDF